MVQSVAWLRLPDAGLGDAGYLRPHGNVAPVRPDGTAPRPVRPGALWTRPEGHDGGRSSPRRRRGPPFSLAARIARLASARTPVVRFPAGFFAGACALLALFAQAQAAGQD